MAVREIILTAQSTAQHGADAAPSTAQHSDCAFFSTVHIHKRKRIKASINMYMDKMYVFSGAFCPIRGGQLDLNLKHGHTWKLRKRIYFNTIFTKTKEDSDEKIKA